jgi:hypothetical protein
MKSNHLPHAQRKARTHPLNINALDAKLLDRAISERGWTLDESDYIGRIRDGQTLNAGLNRTANSY